MKMLTKILFVNILFVSCLFGQIKISSFSPSVYYTYGDYSNGNRSSSLAGYGTISINNYDFFTIGFEKINIDNSLWTYDQYNYSAGFFKNFYPFYLNANYMFVNGTFGLKDINLEQKDFINIYNIGLTFNYGKMFLSSNFSYMNLNGYKSTIIRQYEFVFSLLASENVSVSLKPNHSNIADGRSLYSLMGSINYDISSKLSANITGAIGERAYYFNNELLTLFNQDETQKSMYELKLRYLITNPIQVLIAFQKSDFHTYDINYYIFGVRAFF